MGLIEADVELIWQTEGPWFVALRHLEVWGSWGKALGIFNFICRWGVSGQLHASIAWRSG